VTDDETARRFDRRGLSGDPLLIHHLAGLLGISHPPDAPWRSATVVLLATNPDDVVAAQVIHVQDLDWAVREQSIIELAIQVLEEGANDDPES
jgi:hypothetical protein